jgi:hypothetical protein
MHISPGSIARNCTTTTKRLGLPDPIGGGPAFNAVLNSAASRAPIDRVAWANHWIFLRQMQQPAPGGDRPSGLFNTPGSR